MSGEHDVMVFPVAFSSYGTDWRWECVDCAARGEFFGFTAAHSDCMDEADQHRMASAAASSVTPERPE